MNNCAFSSDLLQFWWEEEGKYTYQQSSKVNVFGLTRDSNCLSVLVMRGKINTHRLVRVIGKYNAEYLGSHIGAFMTCRSN